MNLAMKIKPSGCHRISEYKNNASFLSFLHYWVPISWPALSVFWTIPSENEGVVIVVHFSVVDKYIKCTSCGKIKHTIRA